MTMKPTIRSIVATVISLGILGVLYYGTFLPLRKSFIFIQVLGARSGFRSLQELEQTFSRVLDFPSPIGQEELVRNTSSYVLSFIQQNDNPQIIVPLVEYVQKYYDPIIAYGRGMSFGQDVYLLGVMNEVTLVKTKDVKYLVAAKGYFSKALETGPKRPQALFGMFDVHRFEGNIDGATAIANRILAQWPTDTRTKDALAAFLNQAKGLK